MCKRSVVFLALIAALVLGACSFDTPSEPPAGDQTPEAGATADHVTITFGAISFMRQVYEPLIQAFNADHPGITVQFVSLDEAYQSSGDYSAQTRQIVSMADTAEAPASEEQFNLGLLYDLKPLMNADPSFNSDDFYPNALSSATAGNGAIYKLPQTLEIPLLFYNSDLWAAHGLAAPKPGWTWRDVEAAAQQIAQKQGNTIALYGLADDDARTTGYRSEGRDVELASRRRHRQYPEAQRRASSKLCARSSALPASSGRHARFFERLCDQQRHAAPAGGMGLAIVSEQAVDCQPG